MTVFNLAADRHLFLQLAVSILVAIANGSIFCFSLFSPALSAPPFNFNTRETNLISTVGVITSYFSLPTGQIYDRTSPRVTLTIGASINILGWFLMFGIFSGTLSQGLASVVVCYSITQFAATFFETGSVIPNLDAFSLHEGRIVTIQKTFMGLGTSVIAAVFNAFFLKMELRWFFLTLCVLSGVAGGLGAWIIRRPQLDPTVVCRGLNVDPELRSVYAKPFYFCIGLLFANIAFLFAIDVVGAVNPVSPDARLAFGFIAMVLSAAFFGVLALVPAATRRSAQEGIEDGAAAFSERSIDDTKAAVTVAAVHATETPIERNIHGLAKNVRRPEMWLMWYTSFATWGAMTMVNANTMEIYKATTGPEHVVLSQNAVFVSLFGIGSALGRVFVGLLKEPLKARLGKEIWWMFPVAPALMALTMPLFLVTSGSALRVPFLAVGFGTGVAWGSTVLIIKRVFAEPGRHYSFLYTAGMLTPLFFNLWLFSSTYESNSESQHQAHLSDCDGVACILTPVLVCTALNVLAIGSAVFAVIRFEGGSIFVDPPGMYGSAAATSDGATGGTGGDATADLSEALNPSAPPSPSVVPVVGGDGRNEARGRGASISERGGDINGDA